MDRISIIEQALAANHTKSKEILFEDLLKKLEGKSVHKTIQKILNEKATKDELRKGFFSLGTHIAIEIEKGDSRYLPLLRETHQKLGELL